MDINALNELIARARETVASVVQAEQRVGGLHGRTRCTAGDQSRAGAVDRFDT
jgi:hypothetical protein